MSVKKIPKFFNKLKGVYTQRYCMFLEPNKDVVYYLIINLDLKSYSES